MAACHSSIDRHRFAGDCWGQATRRPFRHLPSGGRPLRGVLARDDQRSGLKCRQAQHKAQHKHQAHFTPLPIPHLHRSFTLHTSSAHGPLHSRHLPFSNPGTAAAPAGEYPCNPSSPPNLSLPHPRSTPTSERAPSLPALEAHTYDHPSLPILPPYFCKRCQLVNSLSITFPLNFRLNYLHSLVRRKL